MTSCLDWAPFLYEEGIHCGEDFGLAYLEHESLARHCELLENEELAKECRSASGLDQQSFYIGGHAVELLAGDLSMNLKGTPKHPSITLIEGKWQEGESLPLRSDLGKRELSII